MTQLQLDHAVADATGESLNLVRDLGFGLDSATRADLEPENLMLAVICPFCRTPVAYPGAVRDGTLPLAECLGCDVYFDVTLDEVFATGSART